MARYAYDVNTTQRYIDVHKQFQGGLKTVDTDDALGAVFLREAENVSISEFGFLEKRYGTYENFKRNMPTGATNLQGYWEFEDFKIYAINNRFFVNNETTHRAVEKEKENEWRYPTLPAYPFEVVRKDGETKDTYRDMNAVNINKVLYIFTGFYPVYAKVVSEELKFYWFSVDIPTFDEIVVTGHNLLEDDYEGLYYSNQSPIPEGSFYTSSSVPLITQSAVSPKFPFQTGVNNSLQFHFNTTFPEDMKVWDFNSPASADYFEIKLDRLQYRTSGAGASEIDFIEADVSKTDFVTKSNFQSIPLAWITTTPVVNPDQIFELLTTGQIDESLVLSLLQSKHPVQNFEKGFIAKVEVFEDEGNGEISLQAKVVQSRLG
jgi:hypothetical protein